MHESANILFFFYYNSNYYLMYLLSKPILLFIDIVSKFVKKKILHKFYTRKKKVYIYIYTYISYT